MSNSALHRKLTRRSFLAGLGVVATLPVIAACAPPPPPTPTPAPAPPKPAVVAPTPTAAPAAVAPTPTAAPKPAAPTPTPAPVTKPEPKAAVELRIHDWAQDEKDEFYGPFWQRFEAANPGVTIKREWFPRADMHVKQLTLAATGQIGDIVRINVAVLTPELVAKGVIQSLSPFIKKDTVWANNDHKQFWPANIQNYTVKGEQWGYPVVGHPGCLQYYFNVDKLTKAGAKLPGDDGKWTLEQALEVYRAGTKSEGGRITEYGIIPCLGGEGAVGVLRAFGGDYYNEEGTKALVGTPESIAGITWLADLYQKHKVAIPPDLKPNDQELFPAEKVMIVVSTSFRVSIFKKAVAGKFKMLVNPPPIGPSGRFETQVSSDGIAISKTSKYPDEAWQVIKAYGSKEHGVKRFGAGLGSPGSRYDVWTDPEFKRDHPELAGLIYDALINPAKAPPMRPWHHPANARWSETDSAINNILMDAWLGVKKPAEAAAEAQKAAQTIMDKPVP